MNFDFLNFGFLTKQKPRVYSPLVGNDEHEERECKLCKFGMPPLHRNEEDSHLPWRERGIDYECGNCKTLNYVANSNSVTISVGTVITICTIVGVLLAGGVFDYISSSFGNILAILFSLFVLAVMVVSLRFAWERLKRSATLIEGRMQFPLMNRKPGINLINLSLTMGLLPWLIAIAFGYFNQKYNMLQGGMIWLMVPVTLLPIFLGKRAGSTKMNVFLAAMFWLFIGAFIVWMVS